MILQRSSREREETIQLVREAAEYKAHVADWKAEARTASNVHEFQEDLCRPSLGDTVHGTCKVGVPENDSELARGSTRGKSCACATGCGNALDC